jgi:hypothetical protein
MRNTVNKFYCFFHIETKKFTELTAESNNNPQKNQTVFIKS